MNSSSTQLRPGDVVKVRPWAEIRATLDENGMSEGLAFMPEMLKYCGRRFVVNKRIAGSYRCPLGGTGEIRDVVLLRGVRCDGSRHAGFKQACVLCWKPAWLTRVDEPSDDQAVLPVAEDSTLAFPYQRADGRNRCQHEVIVLLGSGVTAPKARMEDPTHRIHRISVDEYATLQQVIGEKIVCVGGHWWRRVRPCFFRPLLPFREFPPGSGKLPLSAWLGGAQHVVPYGQQANSTMSFLMFVDGRDYTIDSLRSKARRQVRSATIQFTVSPLTDCALFKEQAFPVYKEFHARTQYRYLAERLKKQSFDKWANAVFEHKTSLALGAYRGPQLCAVSIAHVIEDTLIYSTFFATDGALRDHASSLLLHTVRLKAGEDGGITRVYAGMPKTSTAHGIDDFLMRRGCQLVTKPAFMWLNPASKLLLRCFRPADYARIHGEPAASMAVDAGTAGDSVPDSKDDSNERGAGL